MNHGRIATRYAKALLLFGDRTNSAEAIYSSVKQLAPILLDQEGALRRALGSVVISVQAKRQFAERFFKPYGEEIYRLVDLMIRNERGEYIVRALLVYIALYRRKMGIVYAEVRTVQPCPAHLKDRLIDFVHKHFGGERIEIQYHLDASLIGGFSLNVDGKLFDKSVRGDLRRLANHLIG